MEIESTTKWLKMKDPSWSMVNYPKIDYQSISYYSAPKEKEIKIV